MRLAIRGARPRAVCGVKVRFQSRRLTLPNVRVNRSRRAGWAWTVPADAPSGRWTFSAACRERGKVQRARRRALVLGIKGGRGALVVPSTGRITDGRDVDQPTATGLGGPNPNNPFYRAGYWGECTWYAWERRPDMGNIALGHAKTWLASAQGKKPTGARPAVGAIAVDARGTYGHVAYVEAVFADGSFEVSEYNYAGYHVGPTRRRIGAGGVTGFIYGGPAGDGPGGGTPGGGTPGGGTPGGGTPGGGTPGGGTPGGGTGTAAKGGADFNADGKSDIAWYDQGDGGRIVGLFSNGSTLADWRVIAGTAAGQSALGAADWAGVGDFNADGKSDIAWYDQGDGGRIVGLFSNGSTLADWRVIAGTAAGQSALGAADWAGVGDFNADGKSDIAWYDQGDGGRIVGLFSNGSTLADWRVIAGTAAGQSALGAADWAGVGDFNADGKSDIAWYDQGDGGRIVGLFSNGSTLADWRVIAGTAAGQSALGAADWAGVGDFNADGKSDIAWYDQGDGGRIVGLFSNGSTLADWRVIAGTAAGQSALGAADWAGVGDFNADGKSDIAWYDQGDGGRIVGLFSNGSTLADWRVIAGTAAGQSALGRPDWAGPGGFPKTRARG